MSGEEVVDKLLGECPLFVKELDSTHQGIVDYSDVQHFIKELEDFANKEIDVCLTTPFGREFKKNHFVIDEDIVYLNHGGYGSVLKVVRDVQRKWQDRMEKNLIKFFEIDFPFATRYVLSRLSTFVNCDVDEISFVTNATSGCNSILRSLKFEPHEEVLILNHNYMAVKHTLHYSATFNGFKVKIVDIDFPLYDPSHVVKQIAEAITPNTKLAVIDHIISATASILPIKEIIQVCHEKNVLVLVDGAHSIGQVPLNLKELNPDFFVSNTHKWLCAPKGSAFLYVHKQHQHLVHPLVISHGYKSGYQCEFLFGGTADYTPFLSVLACLQFFERVGAQKIMDRNHNLVISHAKKLAQHWNTSILCSEDMFGSLVQIELPFKPSEKQKLDFNFAETLRIQLRKKYRIEVPLMFIAGKLWARLSAHLHNGDEDYHSFTTAIDDLLVTQA